ncbi:hypothetical protein ACHHV8_27005 [Paenibacillus sp. TAB 01]|uniref:hypothetical protein n=1 Tax=Paenibacillus sp. TAB 01 TaxID=3368988 RepID=UPI0037526DFC
MNLKTWTICFYLLLIYWIAQHIPSVKMLFYPTLGAFSYLFISRTFAFKDFCRLIAGASAASLISSALFLSDTGFISFFAAVLSTIILIQKFRLNAPPILAIALVPFFTHPGNLWGLPLAVLVSLSGLLLTLVRRRGVQGVARAVESTCSRKSGRRNSRIAQQRDQYVTGFTLLYETPVRRPPPERAFFDIPVKPGKIQDSNLDAIPNTGGKKEAAEK